LFLIILFFLTTSFSLYFSFLLLPTSYNFLIVFSCLFFFFLARCQARHACPLNAGERGRAAPRLRTR
jgi:hypothetical protein